MMLNKLKMLLDVLFGKREMVRVKVQDAWYRGSRAHTYERENGGRDYE